MLWHDGTHGKKITACSRVTALLSNMSSKGKDEITNLFPKGAKAAARTPRLVRMVQLLHEIYDDPGANRLGVSWPKGTPDGSATAWSVNSPPAKRHAAAATTTATSTSAAAATTTATSTSAAAATTTAASTSAAAATTTATSTPAPAQVTLLDQLRRMDPAARASLLKQAVSADKPGEPSSAQPAMQLVNGRRSYGDCYMQLGCRKYDDLSVTESFCSGCKTPAHLVCLSLHPADGRCEVCTASDVIHVPLHVPLHNINTQLTTLSSRSSAGVNALRSITSSLDHRLDAEQAGTSPETPVAKRARAANLRSLAEAGNVNEHGFVVGDSSELVVARPRLRPDAHEALVNRAAIAMNFYKVYAGLPMKKELHMNGHAFKIVDDHVAKVLPYDANQETFKQWCGSMVECWPACEPHVVRFGNHLRAQYRLYGPDPAMQHERAIRRKCQETFLDTGALTDFGRDTDIWNGMFSQLSPATCGICGSSTHTPAQHYKLEQAKQKKPAPTRPAPSTKSPPSATSNTAVLQLLQGLVTRGKGAGASGRGSGVDGKANSNGAGKGTGGPGGVGTPRVCKYFNLAIGCKKGGSCDMAHVCSVAGCGTSSHGAAGH